MEPEESLTCLQRAPLAHLTKHIFLIYTLIPYAFYISVNPLNTKRRLLYLKTHFVPRSKHFISVIKTNNFML